MKPDTTKIIFERGRRGKRDAIRTRLKSDDPEEIEDATTREKSTRNIRHKKPGKVKEGRHPHPRFRYIDNVLAKSVGRKWNLVQSEILENFPKGSYERHELMDYLFWKVFHNGVFLRSYHQYYCDDQGFLRKNKEREKFTNRKLRELREVDRATIDTIYITGSNDYFTRFNKIWYKQHMYQLEDGSYAFARKQLSAKELETLKVVAETAEVKCSYSGTHRSCYMVVREDPLPEKKLFS